MEEGDGAAGEMERLPARGSLMDGEAVNLPLPKETRSIGTFQMKEIRECLVEAPIADLRFSASKANPSLDFHNAVQLVRD